MIGAVMLAGLSFAALSDQARCLRLGGDPELVALLANTSTAATAPEPCEPIEVTRTHDGRLRLVRPGEQRTVADGSTARAILASWRHPASRSPVSSAAIKTPQASAIRTTFQLTLGASVGVDDRGEVWHGLQLGADLVLDDWLLGVSAAFSSSGDWKELESSGGGWAARDFQLLLGLGHRFRIGPLSLTPRVSAGWAYQEYGGDWGNGGEDQLRAEAQFGVGWSLGLLGFELIVAGGPFTGLRVTPYRMEVALIRSEIPEVDAAWRGRVVLGVALAPAEAQ